VIIDGNRRWARQMGFEDVREGHRHGAEHIVRLMTWCEDLGIGHVTVYLASVDNLMKRASPEMTFLMRVIEDVVRERLAAPGANWRINPVGVWTCCRRRPPKCSNWPKRTLAARPARS
jgi:short-chain Z-isoprenyl diphosphate synthase